ncbi:MAG TPA: ATP-dependent 6-phosphofructokinase [Anaerolineae bacterium]|nr:ATP-dependent 6-phosphofructokinase [Anaerolineae bacterium]
MSKKCIGILTGGGDAPGLNAVIRAVTVKGIKSGYDIIGFESGWRGLIDKHYRTLTLDDVEDIHLLGGTILHSSRTNIAKIENGFEIAINHLKEIGVDALVAAGGDDTLGVALELYKAGANIVGVPKTVDNDVKATDYTFGFDTAINRVADFLYMLRTTTESHNRVMVVEIMGRHAGWIALHGGIAGGAHMILLPEIEVPLMEVINMVKRRYESGKCWALIAVSEGAVISAVMKDVAHSSQLDEFGHVQLGTGKGIADALANAIEIATGFETRSIVLGHLQRGGTPTAFDKVLGTRLGVHVVEMIEKGKFGMMAALRGGEMMAVSLESAVGSLKKVETYKYETARLFFS